MANVRDITSLPLPRTSIDLLIKSGFRYVSDIISIQPLELAQEIGVTPDIALKIIQSSEAAHNNEDSKLKLNITAKDILLRHGSSRVVITFCRQIDQMLGGGVQIGQITEFCGVPGVGKTQLGIQLALNVQIPEVFNGLGGEAIYIDTEGSFIVERAAEMASEISMHLNRLARATASGRMLSQDAIVTQMAAAQNMILERLLEGIHVFRVHDQTETIATINHLSAYLKLRTKIKVIVIDSIAFHFRQDLHDTTARSRVLSNVAQTLNQLAYEHHLAVVVINHVTTRFDRQSTSATTMRDDKVADDHDAVSYSDYGDSAMNQSSGLQRLVPALGEQWSHCITNRVMLYWHQGKQRRASLVKSPSQQCASVSYCVNEKGIRDVPEDVNRDRKRKLEQQQQQQYLSWKSQQSVPSCKSQY